MAFEIPASEPSPQELARECSGTAENAVEWVRSMSGINLDFSPPSLIALDRILPSLVATLQKDQRDPAIILLGSYLGEVLLHACGGRWETGDVFTGPGLRGLGGKEITISPFSRIRQAFIKIEPDHLASYWNTVVKSITEAKPLAENQGFLKPPSPMIKMLPIGTVIETPKVDAPSDADLEKIIPEETKKFIELLKNDLNVELDYSLNSLQFLDHYLRSLNGKMKKEGQMGDSRVLVYLAGNYLGEVLRKAYGGKWVYVPEQQTAGLVLRVNDPGSTIFPHKAAANMAMEYQTGGVIAYAERVKNKMREY
jgi:hypothetical protein